MFLGMPGRPWSNQAACLSEDPEIFFAPGFGRKMSTEQYREAREICKRCLVQEECLNWALEHGELEHGIWGGLAPYERKTEQERRRFGIECG